jgi:hypothetical protein
MTKTNIEELRPAYVQILLDESGSMGGQEERVKSGINEYVKVLKDKKIKKCRLKINTFDSERYNTLRDGPISKIKKIKDGEYKPNALTPLYDAILRTVKNIESNVKKNGDGVLFIIDTDGWENASQEANKEQITKLLEEKEKEGWTIVYMAADMDAHSASQGMGLNTHAGNTLSYASGNRAQTYRIMGVSTANFAASGAQQTSCFFSGASKADEDRTDDVNEKEEETESFWSSWTKF